MLVGIPKPATPPPELRYPLDMVIPDSEDDDGDVEMLDIEIPDSQDDGDSRGDDVEMDVESWLRS